ncbi:hypothetical protein L345_05419, partial [Ophiophagus hannah]
MYKGSPYSGYPFLMLSDPYLPNGSMSPLESMCKQTIYQGPCNHEQDAGEQDSALLHTVLLSLEGTDSQSEDLPILMDRDITSVARETFCQLWLMNLTHLLILIAHYMSRFQTLTRKTLNHDLLRPVKANNDFNFRRLYIFQWVCFELMIQPIARLACCTLPKEKKMEMFESRILTTMETVSK